MGNIGDAISTTVPTVSTANPGGMQAILNLLAEYKTRLTKKVPVSVIDAADATLNMNGQIVSGVAHLALEDQPSAPSGAPYGRLARYSGNLYYIDASGAVQITSGAGLNAGAIGGIVGDYGGGNPAKVSFVDATEMYEFYDDQSATQWAILKARQIDLVDEATGRSVRVAPSTAITATYDLKLPTGVPAAAALLTIDASGQLAHNATIATAHTFSQNITLSGGAKLKGESDRRPMFPRLNLAHLVAGSRSDTADGVSCGAASTTLDFSISHLLREGDTVTAVEAIIEKGAGTASVQLMTKRSYPILGAIAGSGTAQTSTATGSVPITKSGLSQTVDYAYNYFIRVIANAGDIITGLSVTVTK